MMKMHKVKLLLIGLLLPLYAFSSSLAEKYPSYAYVFSEFDIDESYINEHMIPEDKMMDFYIKYEIKEEIKVVKPYFISHYVVMGDTLEIFAEKYYMDAEEIMIANKLDDDALTLDTLLLIPVSEALFDKMLSD